MAKLFIVISTGFRLKIVNILFIPHLKLPFINRLNTLEKGFWKSLGLNLCPRLSQLIQIGIHGVDQFFIRECSLMIQSMKIDIVVEFITIEAHIDVLVAREHLLEALLFSNSEIRQIINYVNPIHFRSVYKKLSLKVSI